MVKVDNLPTRVIHLIEECNEKFRYGDMSKHFSPKELLDQAQYKLKRGLILYSIPHNYYGRDDFLDAVNMILLGVKRLDEEEENDKYNPGQ